MVAVVGTDASPGAQVLLISADAPLIERVSRLAAVVGAGIEVIPAAVVSRGSWMSAGLVLIDGRDVSDVHGLASMVLPKRPGALLLVPAESDAAGNPWQLAVQLGCSDVVTLPASDAWLIEQMHAACFGIKRAGRVLAVLGACGGVGASTVAAGLATCLPTKRVLLVDTDPYGGGIDLLLGAETAPGIRWPDLLSARGRLSAATMDYALPHVGSVAVVSFGRGAQQPLHGSDVTGLLDTAIHGYDTVIVDAARWFIGSPDAISDAIPDSPAVSPDLFARAEVTVMVVANSVRAVAAAASTLSVLHAQDCRVQLAIRMQPRGLSSREVMTALGMASGVEIPSERAVAMAGGAGELPPAQGKFMRACRRLHEHLAS